MLDVPSMEGLGFIDVPALHGQRLILEDCHGRGHTLEAELLVEPLFARHRVENDLLVLGRKVDEFGNDLFAQPDTLVTWKDRNVADVRAIDSVRECSAGANEFSAFTNEALEQAVGECRSQVGGLFLS